MRRALELAARALGDTSPNPVVGAVLVRDGEIVGDGWHQRAGLPHAEVEALAAAGDRARGATLYVTLEPCNHQGRTPPCTEAVLQAGIARVVAAVADSNPLARGGLAWLRERGVEVSCGLLEDEARRLNRFFFTWIARRRPFVTLKWAMTLDGRAATASGHSQWITGPEARALVHCERAAHDAVLVGIGTVLADNPRLDARVDGVSKPRLRVVLDPRGRTPADARVLDPSLGPTLVLPTRDLSEVLRGLAARDVLSVFVEGGPTVHGAFLRAGLVDRVLAFVAPKGVGGRAAAPAVRWEEDQGSKARRNPSDLQVAPPDVRGMRWTDVRVLECGGDLLLDATF
ncbi:MAG: bifunctional diaminohydroxyphosphoribosylaminopyrimidine deaminase/5-amino-6-(5-phosphoribosylamino)uracil reductase RibD [Armatimonadetes bacterium]|nr:bifunctional diaminohydroxyphosphoribosylaminopyrimidine deaminase/5-amino-6-(5-phosphoribosylamino)uracil reductase RibD [Armatimonadota bacterium]